MKSITSKDNPIFKSLKKLESSAKERREVNQTLLDGLHLVESYCEHIGQPQRIVLSQTSAHQDAMYAFLLQKNLLSISTVLPDALYNEISSVKSPTGIIAVIDIPEIHLPLPLTCAVLLQDIQDPGNLGSILRSAAAANVQHVYLSRACVDAWSPKVLRAAMGAHFCLSIHERADTIMIATQWAGVKIATQMDAAISIFDVNLTTPTLFMIGNEGAGLPDELMNIATDIVSIPMNNQMESLNAACAASVCFFERVRQLIKN